MSGEKRRVRVVFKARTGCGCNAVSRLRCPGARRGRVVWHDPMTLLHTSVPVSLRVAHHAPLDATSQRLAGSVAMDRGILRPFRGPP